MRDVFGGKLNLYSSATGEVYDGISSSGTSTSQYSYNYGVAIGAHYWENKWADANSAATYLMKDLPNYAGTANGYNILPNYGQKGSDGSGFNGIALRWAAYAYVNGAISNSSVLAWMQQNVSSGWAEQNSSGLAWNDWVSVTPNGGQYSFDCSDAVVGMQDVPIPYPFSSGREVACGRYKGCHSGAARADLVCSAGSARRIALARDLVDFGGRIRVIGPSGSALPDAQWCDVPSVAETLSPIFEVVPLQAAAFKLAVLRGIEPGSFRYAPQAAVDEASFNQR